MAKARMIYKSLFSKLQFRSLSLLNRLLCVGLIVEADNTGKGGIHRADPGGIVASWRSSCSRSQKRMMQHLEAVSAVIDLHVWKSHGELFWCLPNFHKFQKLRYIGKSKYPHCPRCGCNCEERCIASPSGTMFSKREKKKLDGRFEAFESSPQRYSDNKPRGPLASNIEKEMRRMRRKLEH